MILIVLRTIHTNFFFFNDTATTEIYPLSLHDALPISPPFAVARGSHSASPASLARPSGADSASVLDRRSALAPLRSEEHTSELQSRQYLVCRLLLEKKKLLPLYKKTD